MKSKWFDYIMIVICFGTIFAVGIAALIGNWR